MSPRTGGGVVVRDYGAQLARGRFAGRLSTVSRDPLVEHRDPPLAVDLEWLALVHLHEVTQ